MGGEGASDVYLMSRKTLLPGVYNVNVSVFNTSGKLENEGDL